MPSSQASRSLACSVTLSILAAVAVAGSASPASPPADSDADAVKACVRARFPYDSSVQSITLISRDRGGGSREVKARVYWSRAEDGMSSVLVRLSSPPDMRGAGLLLLEHENHNDIFMYLPELKRVRRLTGHSLSSSVFGTDFSYEEFEWLQGMGRRGTTTRLADTVIVGRPVHVVELRPASDGSSAYERIVTYVDAEHCVPLQVEFYAAGGQLRKVLTADPEQIRPEGTVPVPRRFEMRNLRQQTSTEVRVEAIELGTKHKRWLFTTQNLESGRD
jgi:hypothetical protein